MSLTDKDYQNLLFYIYENNKYKNLRSESWSLKPIEYFDSYTDSSGRTYCGGFMLMEERYEWGQKVIAVNPYNKAVEIITLIEPIIDEAVYTREINFLNKNMNFYSSIDLIARKCFSNRIRGSTDEGEDFIIDNTSLLFKTQNELAYTVWKLRHKGESIKVRIGYEDYPQMDFLVRHNALNDPSKLNDYLPEKFKREPPLPSLCEPSYRQRGIVFIIMYIILPTTHKEWIALGIMLLVDLIGAIFSDRILIWVFCFVFYILHNIIHKQYWHFT